MHNWRTYRHRIHSVRNYQSRRKQNGTEQREGSITSYQVALGILSVDTFDDALRTSCSRILRVYAFVGTCAVTRETFWLSLDVSLDIFWEGYVQLTSGDLELTRENFWLCLSTCLMDIFGMALLRDTYNRRNAHWYVILWQLAKPSLLVVLRWNILL